MRTQNKNKILLLKNNKNRRKTKRNKKTSSFKKTKGQVPENGEGEKVVE